MLDGGETFFRFEIGRDGLVGGWSSRREDGVVEGWIPDVSIPKGLI